MNQREKKRNEALDSMGSYEKRLSNNREISLEGVDIELLKKCDLKIGYHPANKDVPMISGTIDGVDVQLYEWTEAGGDYEATVDALSVTDPKLSRQLWEKYLPIAKALANQQEGPEAERKAGKLLDL